MSDLVERFRRHVCLTSPEPIGIEITGAGGTRLRDREGREYLDLLAGMGVANVGHGHRDVVGAIRKQAGAYLHAMVYGEYVQEPQVLLAERLASLLPEPLSVTYFTNSGTEAIEGALKTARKHTGRKRFVAFEGAFHGDTFGAMSLGGNPLYRDPFEPVLSGVTHLPFDDVEALDAIDERVAAVFVEPVQAEGGVRIPSAEFLPAVRKHCDAVGALLVFDEVVTGFGRCGELFAFQQFDVTPDVVVLGKALGGGMPLGAFVSSPEILSTLSRDPPLAHVTTFGGHPVSCAAGLAALEILLRDHLSERADAMGSRLRDALSSLDWKGHLVEIRGIGLLVGLELDSAETTRAFAAGCLEDGLVVNWTLHEDCVVRLTPPLVISDEDVSFATERMRRVLERIG